MVANDSHKIAHMKSIFFLLPYETLSRSSVIRLFQRFVSVNQLDEVNRCIKIEMVRMTDGYGLYFDNILN